MPEAPELRHSADILSKTFVGMEILGLKSKSGGRYADKDPDGLSEFYLALRNGPATFDEINVKGKLMWWRLRHPDGPWWVWTTYGMSGRWSTSLSTHTAFKIWFKHPLNDEAVPNYLYFNDPRHFGTIKFVNDERAHERKLASLGPDMLSDPPDEVTFAQCILRRPNRTIAEALMDQSTVSGVGNYVKAESLYRAGISPHRDVTALTSVELIALREHTIDVMRESYQAKGASFDSYRNPDESRGGSQFAFRVYGRSTAQCGHCVVRERTADGRTSHWCRQCQR